MPGPICTRIHVYVYFVCVYSAYAMSRRDKSINGKEKKKRRKEREGKQQEEVRKGEEVLQQETEHL